VNGIFKTRKKREHGVRAPCRILSYRPNLRLPYCGDSSPNDNLLRATQRLLSELITAVTLDNIVPGAVTLSCNVLKMVYTTCLSQKQDKKNEISVVNIYAIKPYRNRRS
jgi:hypothetical protein